MITLWAIDFLQYCRGQLHAGRPAEDSASASSGTGTGFPVDGAGNPITCGDLHL